MILPLMTEFKKYIVQLKYAHSSKLNADIYKKQHREHQLILSTETLM